MRESEKREFAEQEKFNELMRLAEGTFGKKQVIASTDSKGNRIITIISGEKKITRKEHKKPEYCFKDGD